jgi:hypothetical protein
MKTHIVLSSFGAGLLMIACSGAQPESSTSAAEDLGRGAGHSLPDAAAGHDHGMDGMGGGASSGHPTGGSHPGASGHTGGGGQSSGVGQDHGADCKPVDGGPSPCARGEGLGQEPPGMGGTNGRDH